MEYDDNRRLRADDREAELTERFSPQLSFGMLTPPLAIAGGVRADIGRSSDKELDRTDLYSRLNTTYEDELRSWHMNFEWRRESVLRTLITEPVEDPEAVQPPEPEDAGEPGDELPGTRERTDVQRDRFRISPTYRRALTERTSLNLGYRFNATVFEEIPGSNFEDNTSHNIRGGLEYELTPTYTLVGRLDYNRFDAETSGFDQVGVFGGVNHAFSETLQAAFRGGVRYTSFSSDESGSDQDTDFAFSAVVEKRLETGRAYAILQRDVQGGAFGNTRTLDQLDLQWDAEVVPPRGRFSLAGRVFRVENIDTGTEVVRPDIGVRQLRTEPDRVYFQLQPRFSWRFHPQLFVDISYRFRYNDPEGGDSAYSNAAIVGINYAFERQSVSR